MAIEWTQDLATGVDWQDRQHKELFVKIDNLIEAMKVGKGKDEIGKLVKFLDDYVIFHFGNEEKAMDKLKYPEYSSHRSQHEKFVNDISALKKELESSSAPSTVVIKAQRVLAEWLKSHIGKVDKVLGAFLKTKE